jgi:hypothetical protein
MTEKFSGNKEVADLTSDMDKVIVDLSGQLITLFKEIGVSKDGKDSSGKQIDRSHLREIDRLFAKSNNLMSQLGLKKISGVVGEDDVKEYREKILELAGYYQDLSKQIENLNPASKDPKTMTIEEVVDILEHLVDDRSDYFAEVNQRFLELSKGPPLKEAKYRCKRVFQAILAKGDTGEKDFGIWFPEITNQLINKTTNFIDEGRYLFTVHSEKDEDLPIDEVDKLPINEDALDMWDYALARIKGKFGGLESDPDDPTDKTNFDYQHLFGDNITVFHDHLRAKFSNIDDELFEQLFKFLQSHDIKTTGYTAWLARETTRAHGAGPAKLRGEKFEDPLFTVAPYAAGIYSRGRYGDVIPNSSSPDMVLMPRDVAIDIIPKEKSGDNNERKRGSAAALWDIVNSFYTKIMWRGTPSWITEVRSLFGIGNNEIDLYKTMFPMPGEVTVDAYKVERDRRKIDERHNSEIKRLEDLRDATDVLEEKAAINAEIQIFRTKTMENEKKAFIDKWERYGYSDKFNEIGIRKLAQGADGEGYNLSVSQYDTSFKAMAEMTEFFHQPFGKMNFEQCVEKFKHWMDKIIGKAKLVPGRHYVLFPYLTMFAIDKIISSYELRDKSHKVEGLIERLESELEQAGGVPPIVKRMVFNFIHHDKKTLGVFPTLIASREYKQDLYRFKTRVMNGLEERVRRLIPFGWAAVEEDGAPMQVTVPWIWGVKTDKDTSGK